MGLFDSIKKAANDVAQSIGGGNGTVDVVFASLPEDLAGFKSLPQAALATPYDTAALTVLAFCFYPHDKDASLAMLDYLRGPRPLSDYDKQFIRDRFMDKDYVPRSYFHGSTPQNDYQPTEPYTITLIENPHSKIDENMIRLFIRSGGADSPRQVDLRLAKDGKWYLWEQYLLSDIRQPESANPWA
ncbi:MAG: hypothetical protein IKN36_08105 [Clostridia bacterium]|nr:hypothetical protein [Clostridia bacterium]MBR7033422.1 hypothetical protein [Clostridia bacterium]